MRNLLLCFVSRKSHAQASSPTASSGTLAVRTYAVAARIQLSDVVYDHERNLLPHRPGPPTAALKLVYIAHPAASWHLCRSLLDAAYTSALPTSTQKCYRRVLRAGSDATTGWSEKRVVSAFAWAAACAEFEARA